MAPNKTGLSHTIEIGCPRESGSAATLALAAGIDMKVVQAMPRHTNLTTTSNLSTSVLPENARAAAAEIADTLSRPAPPITAPNQPPDEQREAFRYVEEMRADLEDMLTRRRGRLGDDPLSRMIAAEEGGDRVSTHEIITMAMIITAAGHATTTNLPLNALRLLLDDTDRAHRIGHDDLIRKTAIAEVLRLEPPPRFSTRVTTEDVELHGVTIPAGAAVALAATNRDRRTFAQTERVDPERSPTPHLTFASGPHACLGAHLARLAANVVVGILGRVYPGLRAGTTMVRKNSPLRGLESVTAGWV